jgi:hypothetical protein
MTATQETPNTIKQTIDNTQELRDALFHAICLLDHAHPENDTDHRDIAAARELRKLRDLMNQQAYEALADGPSEHDQNWCGPAEIAARNARIARELALDRTSLRNGSRLPKRVR